MSVLYLLTAPPPALEGTDAVWQDVTALSKVFEGDICNLYPLKQPRIWVPRSIYGFHIIRQIKTQGSTHDINHVFASTLQDLPVLRLFKKPIIYTITASLQGINRPAFLTRLKRLSKIVVSNERDREILEDWGLTSYSVIKPGIDTSRFFANPIELNDQLTLLSASAPWVPNQFDSKGFEMLFKLVASRSDINLILLWRGMLFAQLRKKIEAYGIADRVKVINEHVDINEVLKRVHATVLLAKGHDLVKAYPHSLIESLCAGKPVILSDTIPMADFVTRQNCGVVPNAWDLEALSNAVDRLRRGYHELAQNSGASVAQKFPLDRMIQEYRELYEQSIDSAKWGRSNQQ